MCIGELQRVSRELTPNPNVRFATKLHFGEHMRALLDGP